MSKYVAFSVEKFLSPEYVKLPARTRGLHHTLLLLCARDGNGGLIAKREGVSGAEAAIAYVGSPANPVAGYDLINLCVAGLASWLPSGELQLADFDQWVRLEGEG